VRVEVLGGLERRRRWSQDDKARIVDVKIYRFDDIFVGAKVPFPELVILISQASQKNEWHVREARINLDQMIQHLEARHSSHDDVADRALSIRAAKWGLWGAVVLVALIRLESPRSRSYHDALCEAEPRVSTELGPPPQTCERRQAS